ncbi:MAG: hypothetical protein AB8D78_05710 [Akkermansiaceae bacterium]
MNKPNKKAAIRGKRYTPEEKSEVVAFVADHNSKNGRGGQSTASAKFGISQLTIASWLKNAGMHSSNVGTTSTSNGGLQKKLTAMLSLGQEIEQLERELNAKRKEFGALKASL